MLENFKEKIFKRNNDFPWQSFTSETIIIDPENNQSFELNELGTFIWQKLDGKTPVSEIIDGILKEYETDDEQVIKDLNELIISMIEARIIIGDAA